MTTRFQCLGLAAALLALGLVACSSDDDEINNPPLPEIDDVSAEFAATKLRPMLPERYAGEADIESYQVLCSHEGPVRISFSAVNADGFRVWGGSQDPDVMGAALADEEFCGRRARFSEGVVEPL